MPAAARPTTTFPRTPPVRGIEPVGQVGSGGPKDQGVQSVGDPVKHRVRVQPAIGGESFDQGAALRGRGRSGKDQVGDRGGGVEIPAAACQSMIRSTGTEPSLRAVVGEVGFVPEPLVVGQRDRRADPDRYQ